MREVILFDDGIVSFEMGWSMTSSTKIFISYAKEDRTTALRLYEDLKRNGVVPWIDVKNLIPGQRWADEIRKIIVKESGYFVALLSSNSVNRRGYVHKELKLALDIEDEHPPFKNFIIPVRLDDCPIAYEELEKIQWIDLFESYEEGVRKLLIALHVGDGNFSLSPPPSDALFKKILSAINEYSMLGGPSRVSEAELKKILKEVRSLEDELQKLELKGYIVMEQESFLDRTFKFYSITDEGKRYFLLNQFRSNEFSAT